MMSFSGIWNVVLGSRAGLHGVKSIRQPTDASTRPRIIARGLEHTVLHALGAKQRPAARQHAAN